MSECIVHRNVADYNGYAWIKENGRTTGAHRAAWEDAIGPIPDGMMVAHLCDTPRCVNVRHMVLTTPARINARIMAKGHHRQANVTRCPAGHEYNESNTLFNRYGHRSCRECHRLANIEYRRRIKEGQVQTANAEKTHCNAGHELTPENTYVTPTGGYRRCRECRTRYGRERRARRKAAADD